MQLILLKSRRLNKANQALSEGKYQKAFKLSQALVNSPKEEISYRANFICGLALYKQKKYEDSLQYIDKSCLLKNYRHDWYCLAMALAFSGKLEKAETAFNNIYRTNAQTGYMYTIPVPGLLFQYLQALKRNQFIDAAIRRANELKQMYIGVGPDTMKQVQRGLPSYPTFRKEVQPLFEPDKFVEWEKDFRWDKLKQT